MHPASAAVQADEVIPLHWLPATLAAVAAMLRRPRMAREMVFIGSNLRQRCTFGVLNGRAQAMQDRAV
jgi:hypothetical protein